MDFVTVSPELQRGQKVQFSLSAPMRSADQAFAGHQRARRLPAAGQRQRHTRLRRTGAPRQRPVPAARARCAAGPAGHLGGGAGALEPWSRPTPPNPCRSPCCGRWRTGRGWRPGVPGGTIPVRLIDDELAASLAGGGRLDVLLSAAEFATSHDVDPDGAVGRSVCLAVDPDLLVTVNAMTAGYVVSDSPAGPAQEPGTPTHPGAGQAAAATWLNRLRALAHRMCVAPLPYAQADLDAVATDRRPGPQRDRDQRGRRHRRPDPGCRRGPRRHPDPGRLADPPGRRPAQRQRQHRRDRPRRLLRRRLQAPLPPTPDTAPRTAVAAGGARAVRPRRRRRLRRRRRRPGRAQLPRLRAC